ncbi:MAG: phage integrase SAM-like domain-containing protein, partial [Acholeplasmataceae bacterium]|nr:phage integrase SAM-like domain-containing protein [Acholeplasmataceae bacterium]
KYKYLAKMIKAFKPNTTFSQIDKDWYNHFMQFLTNKQIIKDIDDNGEEIFREKKDLQPGSISNYIKNLKFLMGLAVEKDISKNKNYNEKWFARPKEQKGYGNIHIALNVHELNEIFNFNTTKVGLNPTHDKAKDLFLVGCYTGLRVSDFNSGLSEKDFQYKNLNGKKEKVLIKPTKKTGSISYTPAIWSELQFIFEKYNYQLPRLSDNTIRTYVQKICKYINGFEKTSSWFITIGGRTEKIEKEKWKMVGTHTGRRSFITNLKSRGYSFEEIGEFTGQSTPAIIKEYDKTPRTDSVIRIKQKYEKKLIYNK